MLTGAAVLTVDRAGRRPLLLGGVAGIVVALLALGGLQYLGAEAGPATLLSCLALLLYVGAYQVGQPLGEAPRPLSADAGVHPVCMPPDRLHV